jgi:flagellar biosynthesis/type III secretory pathway M-ring protein FliF/YscJ
VKIDSNYLLSKTVAELKKDAAKLTQMGLEVIIDLRRDQMHHDGITLYPNILLHRG